MPIGIQTFDKIRADSYVYIDKTALVYELVQTKTPYFLARPRRFGKSLLISTLKAYFEGRKELFTGLKIAELEKEWIPYPVIHIDFGRNGYETNAQLKIRLNKILTEYETLYGITKDTDDEPTRLETLLQRVNKQTGKQVVVLVDEYDNPLITSENLTESKKIYRGFFSVLKAADKYIKFAFITGVTKFAKTSIFSGTNQPEDITDDENFSAICGNLVATLV